MTEGLAFHRKSGARWSQENLLPGAESRARPSSGGVLAVTMKGATQKALGRLGLLCLTPDAHRRPACLTSTFYSDYLKNEN